ncbi:MAG: DUF3179 domain-containing (seleno)protein [Salinirussus sp.]
MDRRAFLRLAGMSGVFGTAGCLATPPSATATAAADQSIRPTARHGVPSDICDQSIVDDAGIYAITAPAFAADWQGKDIHRAYRHQHGPPRLVDEQTIIGVRWDDGARAYPLSVLSHHEVVNDDAGGPILVTFCPLCSSGMVASRRVDNTVTNFAVSGQLWIPEGAFAAASIQRGRSFGADLKGGRTVDVRRNGNLVLYDAATRSFWSQLLAAAICGPQTGTELEIRPSKVATWGQWLSTHPETDVLLPPPYSETVDPGTVLGKR